MHLKICTALLLLTPAAAFANNVDLKTQLQSCQQIADEEQRLSCFDQIVSQLDHIPAASAMAEAKSETQITQVVQSSAVPTPQTQQLTEKFGLKKPKPEDVITEISSKVVAVEADLRNKLLITLENGQKWRQIDQEYIQIKPGDSCLVKRGAIGSFLLGIEGAKKRIRVRRVE